MEKHRQQVRPGVRALSAAAGLGWLACALLAGASQPARAEPLVLAVNEWCPYSCAFADGRRGILPDIVSEIFAGEGVAVSFVDMPLARGIESARKGQIQGVVGIVPALAPDLSFPDEAVIDTQFCFFTDPASTWQFKGFKHNYGKLVLGVAFGKAIDARLPRAFVNAAPISGTAVTRRMITMLGMHRLDALLEDRRSVEYLVRQQGLAPLRMAGCIDRKTEYVAFAPAGGSQGRQYADMFSRGMLKLRHSGRLAHILADYADK